MNPIIFCNVAWMKNYHGARGDKPKSSAAYVKKYGTGSEIHNFNPTGGTMRGFVQVRGNINIKRLGADPDADSVDGVTVVWVAPSPLIGTCIVGWYKAATIYPETWYDNRVKDRLYNIEASPKNCKLLQLDQRVFQIPRKGKGAMGQANVWYAENVKPRFIKEVRDYIKSGGKTIRKIKQKALSRRIARQPDPMQMRRVEAAAVQMVSKYYTKLNYTVRSVERDNVGWDLQAYLTDKKFLRLEVKGLSGDQVSIELTPNEYRNLKHYPDSYRLCVVTSAIDKPKMYIFSYSPDQNGWEDGRGNVLKVQKISSARMYI